MSQIDNVLLIPRRLIKDERGWFLKAITGTETKLPQYTGEVYLTMGKSGQKKGGHYHPLANEWFTVIDGTALLILEDVETKERKAIELSLDSPQTVFVPNNVAHIFSSIGNSSFIVLAYSDLLYNPADTITYNF